ncbi:Flavorubredoxin [Kandleria vitulina]|uniref:Flavorubredoxin n=1 Tax=Kandleria vitulina TaxID=1630 RepID=A0A1H2QX73_9FIRM|nr:flavin reductase [Kandleria vitulina]SDW11802.1 Flavorubredoxin [Kandleria vitulina]
MNNNVSDTIKYVGVNDHSIDLFEGQYHVPHGMCYNSYVIIDEKIAVMDTVDIRFGHEWLDHIHNVLDGRKPDYLIIQHMEPDHSANIENFLNVYPDVQVVGNVKTFTMMEQFFGAGFAKNRVVVKNMEILSLGSHELTFVFAPMVHWPEVMVTYDAKDKVLFSADGFGKFGALDYEEDWDDEARRYYIGIVGKYGMQVQALLKKAATLDIKTIAPLHGPVLKEHLEHYIGLYDKWSSYDIEKDGILVAYTSVYGHTKQAVETLVNDLKERKCLDVKVYDLARSDMSEAVADAFSYGKVVLATTTYNADMYPFMREFIDHLTERNFQNRTVAMIENGSWAPMAAKCMTKELEGCKKLNILSPITIKSAMHEEEREAISQLADTLCMDYVETAPDAPRKNDMTALFRLGYGLYVITTNDGNRDNGCIVNTVTQVAENPNRLAVCINKNNYTDHIVSKTGKLNVNCLSEEAPFSVFERYGFKSGRSVDKFEGLSVKRSDNGLVILPQYINAIMSLHVESSVDLGTHNMYICTIEEARVVSNANTMTYTYYQNNVKPKPETEGKKGWVCTVCGYVYEGENIPDDFICPLCKHGVSDFEKIE